MIQAEHLSKNHSNSSDICLSSRLYSLFPSTLFFRFIYVGTGLVTCPYRHI